MPDTDTPNEQLPKALLACSMVAVLVCIFLRGFILESLWLDETHTHWTIEQGLVQTYQRAISFQGMSPFYFLVLWFWAQIFGTSELVLRLPSIVAFLATLYILYKICREYFNAQESLIALILTCSSSNVQVVAVSARPYSFALFFSIFSIYCLLNFKKSDSLKNALIYGASLVLTFYSHYLFAIVGILHLAILFLSKSSNSAQLLKKFFAIVTASIIFCLPGFYHLYIISKKQTDFAFSAPPNLFTLLQVALPLPALVYSIVVVFLIENYRAFFEKFKNHELLNISLIWWLTAPVLLFVLSVLGPHSIFVSRYMVWSVLGLAVLLAMVCSSISSIKTRKLAFLYSVLFVLIVESGRKWEIENWRFVSKAIRELKIPTESQVLLYSGLIESKHLDWFQDQERLAYLQSPLNYYPISRKTYSLPPQIYNPQEAKYFEEVLSTVFKSNDKFIFICLDQTLMGEDNKIFSTCDGYERLFESKLLRREATIDGGLVRGYLVSAPKA